MLTAGGGSLLPWVAARLRDGGHVHYFAGGEGAALPCRSPISTTAS
jgi:hypothetical protein